ncbi:4,5-dihydroxyphthalate decarboxylase [Marivita sp.]|uniref:4,5-dihydroxyphthalate decarboxylase n=1 Tax=Marivita sp. TaxID=2003365 RepID=UPI0025BC506F|nr:4,5-dihydroxyphthalate decarboxylase [Marivita sp.]
MKLTLATWDHDRVMPLHGGQVPVEGVTFESHILPTGKLFPIAVQEVRFDITELSVSSYVLQVSRGECAYTAIPAFVSRAFRHSGFYARTGSEIETLSDLRGKRVGVPEYQMTAALWMRGLLADEHGVDPAGITWRTGALDAGVRHERLSLELPDGMVVAPIADGETLQDLLLAGEIDALLAPKPPQAFLDGDPRLRRIIPDFGAAERAYHARTGYFPIMHLIAVRKTLVAEHPWLPEALMQGFTTARDMALARLEDVWLGSANRLSLPWLNETMETTRAALGPDPWPYGYAANLKELETICRYSSEQYLAARRVSPEELFPEQVR